MPVSLPHNLPIAPRLSGLSADAATCFSSALPGTCSGWPSTETHRAPLSNQSHPRESHCSPLVQVHLQDRSGQEDPRGQEDLCLQMLQERPACRAHPGGTETRTMSAHGKHPCPGPTDPSGRGQTRDSPEGAEGGRSFGRQGPAWMEGGTPHTHRWARQAWESSLTTLPRQTDDASLSRQTLGTWWTIGTLREERREMRTDRVAQPLPPSQHSSVCAAPLPGIPTAPAPSHPMLCELRSHSRPCSQGPWHGPGKGLTEGPSSPGSPFSPGGPAGPWRPGSPARPGGPLSPRAPLGPSFPEGPGGPGGPGLP